MKNTMTKFSLLRVIMTAALLTTPAKAEHGQLTSRRLANARMTTTASGADSQTCRKCSSALHIPADRDAWGHWGSYYGPMVPIP